MNNICSGHSKVLYIVMPIILLLISTVAYAITPIYQPDLRLRTISESIYVGNDIYNTTGIGQTRSITTAQGTSVTYVFLVQNDGNTVDNFVISGQGSGGGWIINYYVNNIGDITEQVSNSGWDTGQIIPSGVSTLWVKITPGTIVAGGASKTLTITARSASNSTKLDIVKAITTQAIAYKPDLYIRSSFDNSYIGDNVYNTTGIGQTKTLSIIPGNTGILYVKYQNDGNVTDTLKITGTASDAFWSIQYFEMSTNIEITNLVTLNGYYSSSLSSLGVKGIYARVRPVQGIAGESNKTITITAISVNDNLKKDVVKTNVTTPPYQPDLHLRIPSEASYSGDNTYNTDPSVQSKRQYCATNAVSTFYIKVQNDGGGSDKFIIKASTPLFNSGWKVRWYIMSTNIEVTNQITSEGYTTDMIAKNGITGLFAKVYATNSLTVGAILTINCTATSFSSSSKLDSVQLIIGAIGNNSGEEKINPIDGATLVWVPADDQTSLYPGFWIYKYEVTAAQYLNFCSATGRSIPQFPDYALWGNKTGWTDSTISNYPIVYVNYADVDAYATWAGMRLPTEAQWEYAASGPEHRNYPWGGIATEADPYNGWDVTRCANYYNSILQGISTWPVGSFPTGVSWCGAMDMSGNVLEWTMDWYDEYKTGRAQRGGSYANYDSSLICSMRFTTGNPTYSYKALGFRCVRRIYWPGS